MSAHLNPYVLMHCPHDRQADGVLSPDTHPDGRSGSRMRGRDMPKNPTPYEDMIPSIDARGLQRLVIG